MGVSHEENRRVSNNYDKRVERKNNATQAFPRENNPFRSLEILGNDEMGLDEAEVQEIEKDVNKKSSGL